MRKIVRNAVTMFRSNTEGFCGDAIRVSVQNDGFTRILYHGNVIVRKFPDGKIDISDGGNRTPTVIQILNAIANPLGCKVLKRDERWVLCRGDWLVERFTMNRFLTLEKKHV